MQAVLFDMDGLLLDTERLWFDVESEVMGRLGCGWGPEDQAALVGGPMERTVAYMLARAGNGTGPEQLARWIDEGMVARLRESVPLMPGAKELLDALRLARIPRALVTNSLRTTMDAALAGLGPGWFDATVCADDVTRTKPDAQPYLTAADRLGVEPASCVALEDSPNGVASAAAAGCVVVAVPSVVPIEPGPGRVVVESLTVLHPAELRRLHSRHAATS